MSEYHRAAEQPPRFMNVNAACGALALRRSALQISYPVLPYLQMPKGSRLFPEDYITTLADSHLWRVRGSHPALPFAMAFANSDTGLSLIQANEQQLHGALQSRIRGHGYNDEPGLTVNDLTDVFGVSKQTVYSWENDGVADFQDSGHARQPKYLPLTEMDNVYSWNRPLGTEDVLPRQAPLMPNN